MSLGGEGHTKIQIRDRPCDRKAEILPTAPTMPAACRPTESLRVIKFKVF